MALLGRNWPKANRRARRRLRGADLKDLAEEDLFARRRDLFSTLDPVLMNTTGLYFEGAGGQSLARRGFSKDHRPDRIR